MMRGSLRTCSWVLRARLGLTGGRHREGAARLLRRARGNVTEREKEGNWAGNFAHHAQGMMTGQRVERRRQQGGLATAAARAALRQAGTQAPGAARLLWQLSLVNKRHVRAKIVHG
jgi:hypothetical protein